MPALSFIELLPSGQFRINPKAAEYLERIQSPLAVVACAGKYRTGKSSLLNRVLLDVKGKDGFGVGQTVQACTKGLWMHTDVLGVPRSDGSVTNVLIIDTEGLGAFNATSSHDSRIFSLALLISSYFIYNSVGTIDEQAISTLSLVANISKLVKSKSRDKDSNGDSNADTADEDALQSATELGQLFPDFLWVVRDFSLQLRDESGEPLTSDQYLEQALRDKTADGSSAGEEQASALAEKNHLRALLRAYFPRRQCVTMVRPCANEEDLQRVDSMPKDEMRREFWETARHVRATVLGGAPPKTVANGKMLSGRGLLRLCQTYVDAMNSGVAPVIRDSWALLTEVQFRDAVEAAEQHFRDAIEATGDGPCDPLHMQKIVGAAEHAARQVFARESPDRAGPMYEQFAQKLIELLRQLADDAQQTNLRCLEKFAREILEQRVDNRQFETWTKFIDAGFGVASEQFFGKIGRSERAKAVWAQLALPRVQAVAQQFGERFDAIRADAERYKESASKAEQWKAQVDSLERELRDAQTKMVEHEAGSQAKQEALEERLQTLSGEVEAARSATFAASSVTDEEWDRREQCLRDETAAAISKAEAVARKATLELERLKQNSEETRVDFHERFAALQARTEQSLAEMRAANAQEIDALQALTDESVARAEEAEARLETSQAETDSAKRKFEQISRKLDECESQLREERSKSDAALQSLNEKWRNDVRAQHEQTLELTRAAKVAEAKLVLQQSELAALREKLQEERPNVEAERAIAALERVEQESQRLQAELFESRRQTEEEQATVRKLERQLRDQQSEHEMAQHNLKMNYEVEAARTRAQSAVSRRNASAVTAVTAAAAAAAAPTTTTTTGSGSNLLAPIQSKRVKLF